MASLKSILITKEKVRSCFFAESLGFTSSMSVFHICCHKENVEQQNSQLFPLVETLSAINILLNMTLLRQYHRPTPHSE